jgi:DNA-binding CsgD family transcriptional regulator
MAFDTSAGLVRETVRTLSRADLDPQEFLYEVSARIGRVVPHDASGWMTLDPDTLLPSGTLETSKSPELVRALWRSDGLEPNGNTLTAIAKRRSPITVTRGLPPSLAAISARVKLMDRVGLAGDDMRALLRANGHTWGLAVLYRETGSRPFDARERAFMAEISTAIGDGLRLTLVRRPEPGADLLSPGVVVFGTDGTITSATAEANRMMGLTRGDAMSTLYAVGVRASMAGSAKARLRLADGRWVQLHGAPLLGATGAATDDMTQTAVTLVPASSSDLTSMLLRMHGLTARELQVTDLLMHGRPTDEIALQLHISRHTLRDHVKAIFAKVGATSRSQLMALISDYVAPSAPGVPQLVAHERTPDRMPWPRGHGGAALAAAA